MHLFSGPALFSLKMRVGCFTFIVCFVSCLWSCARISAGRIVKLLFVLWLKRVRRTTAGICGAVRKLDI